VENLTGILVDLRAGLDILGERIVSDSCPDLNYGSPETKLVA
jgi:hypothetical protein